MQKPDAKSEIDIPAFQKQVKNSIELILFTESLEPTDIHPFSDGYEASKREAEGQINRVDVKKAICRGLQSFTNDVYKLGEEITLVVLGAVIAGTIVMPTNPLIIGWIVVLVSRVGVKVYCSDDATQSNL